MNDFELQRRLRDLRTPREPDRDLFPAISARMQNEPAPHLPVKPRRWWPVLAVAATLGVALLTGALALLRFEGGAGGDSGYAAHPATLPGIKPIALEGAPGGDPRLAAAGIVLDDANEQLRQALADRPDAVFLVGLLNRTQNQRGKLERLGHRAG